MISEEKQKYSEIVLNNEQLYAAYKDLKPTEFAVWLYCVEYQTPNKEGVMRNYGISEHGYNDAIKSLKVKRYLEGQGKQMVFNACPKPIVYNLDNIMANISEKQKVELYQKTKPKSKYIIISSK